MTRKQAIHAAATVADALGTSLARYKTRASSGPMLAAACLAATIADCLVAVVHVAGSHGQAHAPTLARGMIESMLDLEMLCTNGDYLKPLRLATALGKIKVGERFLAQATMLSSEQRDAVRANLREEHSIRDKLKAQGVEVLSIEKKFKRAPKSAPLWTYYWHFCSPAHNDLRALAGRHLRGDHVVLGGTLSDDEFVEILAICTAVALNVYEFMPKFLKVTATQLDPQYKPLGLLLRRMVGAPPPHER